MRGIVRFAALWLFGLGFLSPIFAEDGPFDPLIRCVIGSETPLVKGEGLAERVGEVRLNCTGGDPNHVRMLSLFIISPLAFTSDIVNPKTGETESTLLIDEPKPGEWNESNGVDYFGQVRGDPDVLPGDVGGPGAPDSGNVYPGFRAPANINRIDWDGIPFRPAPPGETRVLRLVNIRLDVSPLDVTPDNPGTVVINLGTATPNVIALGGTAIPIGFARSSLEAEYRLEGVNYEIILKERYPEAFRKRIASDVAGLNDIRQQGLLDNPYFTESGFTPDSGGLTRGAPGVADQGTRFVATFNDLKPGVYLTAPARVLSENLAGDPTELEVRRVVDFEPDFSGGILLDDDDPDQLVPVADGLAHVVYEVLPQPPYRDVTGKDVIDSFRIPVKILLAQPTDFGSPSVVVNYAPFNETRTMSQPDPEPRFFSDRGGFVFPVEGGAISRFSIMRYTPSDEVPVIDKFELRDVEAISDSVMVIDGDSWLSATPEFTPTTARIILAANPVGLPTGRHFGAVSYRVDGDGDGTPLAILPVVLDVAPPPEIMVDTSEIFFRATAGAAPPPHHRLFVNGRNKFLQFEIGTSTASGGNWLAASPSSGPTPAFVLITIDQMGLIPGRYEGAISVRAAIAANSPQLIPVVLEVVPPQPAFHAGSIGNAASYEANGLSPGEIFMIFGSNLGPNTPAGVRLDENGRVATVTGGTRILIDGVPAPMILASKTQSGGVAPYNIAGKATVNVQVEIDGWKSEAVTVPVLPTKPGIFTADSSGTGQGAILNANGTLNSPANPAPVNSVVTMYLTGVGETDPFVHDGSVNTGPNLPKPVAPAVIRMGGVESVIEFLAGAPGLVAGAMQANARVTATPGEKVPVQAVIGGRISNTVYISIGP